MYTVKDIKIIPYVRFQTPDGTLYDTMEEALAHRPPYCRPGQYAMWRFSEGKYKLTAFPGEATLIFISDCDGVFAFERDCDWAEASTDGVSGSGWYAWEHSEESWVWIPNHIGENLVLE